MSEQQINQTAFQNVSVDGDLTANLDQSVNKTVIHQAPKINPPIPDNVRTLLGVWWKKLRRNWDIKLGDRHPDVATGLNNLAGLYESQGKYEAAKPLYQQALSLRREILGDRHPAVATSLNNLAFLYNSQGRYEAAEPLYQQALSLRREILGGRHPSVADSLFNLATLYYKTQRYSEALQSIQLAIQIYEQTLGTEHPRTQNALSWLQLIQNAM